MKYLVIAVFLLSTSASTPAQEDVKAKHAAYYLCIEHIENDPNKAYEYCSDYLNKYPNDDKRLTDFAGKFVTAYTKISTYVKSVPLTYFTEVTPRWAVYVPGLEATIPSENSRDKNHPILIKREYGSPAEERLLAKAEALYQNQEPVASRLLKEWRYMAEPYVVMPDGEPKWWGGPVSTVLTTDLVTTEAVLYYYNKSQAFRNKEEKPQENGFKFLSTTLKYEASIKKMDVYERAGRSFSNVYVANMTLTWGQVCGGLCGYGFTRNKIVVMSPNGEILEMFLDDPANRSSWIS
ncbi:MAG TPA: hypothetical protein VFS90_04265 [Pyrinomonadaceae bacterium]|nr:hypothetical protein [Pyrinomonadaceae bacterium]